MRRPELETEISLLGASNRGGSVGDLKSNRLGACAEMRRVEESTADEVDLGARVQHQEMWIWWSHHAGSRRM